MVGISQGGDEMSHPLEKNDRLYAACQYIKRGWPVFPLHSIQEPERCTCGKTDCSKPGKHPRTQHGLKEATTEPAKISEWWSSRPNTNIGVLTGPVSNLLVIDIDEEDGQRSIEALGSRFGSLPITLESRTGRGRHLYFRYPPGGNIRNSTGKLGEGLDVRAEGGYVVAPPSVHASGKNYQWVTETEPVVLPGWTMKILTQPERNALRYNHTAAKIPQGQRNALLTSLAGSMRRRGTSVSAIEAALVEENRLRCDPPLPESEVRMIAQSVGRYAATVRPGDPLPVPGILASDVTPQIVTWLWPNHIPFGKIAIFDGDPGLGKSTVTIDLEARVTRGWPMPDGAQPGCPPAGAVVVNLEDGAGDTIRPRLEAAGAALEKVRIISSIKGTDGIDRTPTLPVDLPYIEAAIKDVNAKILVLDPFVAVLGSETNSYRDQDIRRVLALLAALAEKTGVAVICVRHLDKGGGQNPKYRGGGSIGSIGAARAAFLFGEKPGEEGRYVFAPVQGNLWRGKPPALEFTASEKEIEIEGEKVSQPVILWRGLSNETAASILAQPKNDEESNGLADAKDFLLEVLKEGPKISEEISREARRAKVAQRTLDRAKATLGIRSRKIGFGMGQHWVWLLPDQADELPNTANVENMATFEQVPETQANPPTSSSKAAKPEELAIFDSQSGQLFDRPAEENAPASSSDPDGDVLDI